ncbi:MAG: MoxR family ATPase [Planctomycetes bacterium]|nr:MoxR family ATPase [Planctomycetota bacterium]
MAESNVPIAKSLLSFTRPLGIEGWSKIEPILLASLISREPLLLVGLHGTAKSFLLERMAEELCLEFRSYNASLLSFDDLVGIPMPDESGNALRYITTPTAIWDAEAVFIDEINRTRPDLQNKLFPLIHDRRVQGVKLEKLVHRWAAMNPPPQEESGAAGEEYLGAEPLDPALADRFVFLIAVPDWGELVASEREQLLLRQFATHQPLVSNLVELVDRGERLYAALRAGFPPRLAQYFIAFEGLAASVGERRLSPRRLSMLMRAALAIHAARGAIVEEHNRIEEDSLDGASWHATHHAVLDLRPDPDWESSCFLAVQHGLPVIARRGRVDHAALLAAHRQAWTVAALAADDPRRELLGIAEPVERMMRALKLGARLPAQELAQFLLDGVASITHEARRTAVALAVYLALERLPETPATLIETLARDVRRVLVPGERRFQVAATAIGPVKEVGELTASLDRATTAATKTRDAYSKNLLESLLPEGYGAVAPREVLDLFHSCWTRLSLGALAPVSGARR